MGIEYQENVPCVWSVVLKMLQLSLHGVETHGSPAPAPTRVGVAALSPPAKNGKVRRAKGTVCVNLAPKFETPRYHVKDARL